MKKMIIFAMFLQSLGFVFADQVKHYKCDISVDSIDTNGEYLWMRKGPGIRYKRIGGIPNDYDFEDEFMDEPEKVGEKLFKDVSIKIIGWTPGSHWLRVETKFSVQRKYKNIHGEIKVRDQRKHFIGWVSGKKLGHRNITLLLNDNAHIYKTHQMLEQKYLDVELGTGYTNLHGVFGCVGNKVLLKQSNDQGTKVEGWVELDQLLGDAQF